MDFLSKNYSFFLIFRDYANAIVEDAELFVSPSPWNKQLNGTYDLAF